MALRLRGSTSGYAEIDAPAVAGDVTLTLPSTTGTINVKDASGNTEVGTGVTFGNPSANIFTINNTGGERLRIAADGTVSIPGALNVSGVLTYEDVTSVDAIGLSTFRDGLNTKDVGITTISTSIVGTGTTVDVFIYDTSKDSDGGEWRKRTSHTSWYNETLNTATRGSRREFPAVAVIVAETSSITIYDGDDPDLPMWMVFENAGVISWAHGGTSVISTISILNGVFVFGLNDGNGGIYLNFVKDNMRAIFGNGNIYDLIGFTREIINRNQSFSYSNNPYGDGINIVNTIINDVAMTVLPNAPIDDATGLPIPTIAVATNGGVSIIKDDGTVVDGTSSSSSNYSQTKRITITEENYLWWLADYNNGGAYLRDSFALSLNTIPSSDFTWDNASDNLSTGTYYAVTTGNEGGEIKIGSVNTWAWNKQERNALGGPAGLAIHKPNIGSETNSLIVGITSSYNTGWMHGDIKGAFLSGISTTNVTGSNLIDVTAASWSTFNGSGTVSNPSTGVIQIVDSDGNYVAYQDVTSTVVGKQYILTYNTTAARELYIEIRDTSAAVIANGNQFNYTGTYTGPKFIKFTATTTTTRIMFSDGSGGAFTVSATDLQLRLAEEDRSVNDKGLQVFGTVTKSPVAGSGDTAAELVGYSNFSTSNYLVQPYNSDLVAGTGSQTFMGWVYGTMDSTLRYVFSIGEADSNEQFRLGFSDSSVYFDYGSGSEYSQWNTNYIPDNVWTFVVATINAGDEFGKLYINGVDKGSPNTHPADAPSTFLTSSTFRLVIGIHNTLTTGPWSGSLALFRYSHSVPSPEQIKKIYEDEKVLFQENAKATLYGSSDAVTALAYDEVTDQLHVGTSSGRSDFQGLRRINNTTTAVTTAISAHDSFILEE